MKIKKCLVLLVVSLLLFSASGPVSADTTGQTTAEVTFTSGTLSLSEMLSFSFGSHTITSETLSHPAMESKIFLEVRDLRGTGKGWKVSALATQFNPGENPTLPGASINFLNGVPVPAQIPSTAPSVIQNIKLDCDGEASVPIASAAVGTGLGVWTIEWNGNTGSNLNVTLDVPGGVATIGTHVVTITWTLADTP